MLDILVLRSEILTLLNSLDAELGKYSFPDGSHEPALSVLPDLDAGWDYPPAGTKTTGLEVVISVPLPEVQPLLGGSKMKIYKWDILLKQWDSSRDLIAATEALADGLPYLISSVVHSPPNAALGIIEQCRLSIVEYDYQEAAVVSSGQP